MLFFSVKNLAMKSTSCVCTLCKDSDTLNNYIMFYVKWAVYRVFVKLIAKDSIIAALVLRDNDDNVMNTWQKWLQVIYFSHLEI